VPLSSGSSADTTTPEAPRRQLSLAAGNRLIYLFAAGGCFLFFTVLAIIQPSQATPHAPLSIRDWSFWFHPIVLNEIKRLPRVRTSGSPSGPSLNAVWASGKDIWIAGDDGVLLHSTDEGTSWNRLPEQSGPGVQGSAISNWSLVTVVRAASVSQPDASQKSQAIDPANKNLIRPQANSTPFSAVAPSKQLSTPFRPSANTPNSPPPSIQPTNSPPTQLPAKNQRTSGPKRESLVNPKVPTASNVPTLKKSCSIVGRNLIGVYFLNEETGYVWLAQPNQGDSPSVEYCATNNGAQTWTASTEEFPEDISAAFSRSDEVITRVTPNYWVSVGTKGTVVFGNPANWSRGTSRTSADLKGIFFLNGRVGYAVGSSGTAIKTTDAGMSWFPVFQGLEGERLGDSAPHELPAPWYYLSWILVGAIAAPALRKPTNLPSEETIANLGISDRPLEPGDPDALGYRELSLAISRFLRNENTIAPITLAITGEWGTGKSSIMNLLRRDLASRGLQPIWFNAWHNQTEDDLFATILQAVRKQGVPQWWEFYFLPFRFRLLCIRWRSRWQSITLLLMATALLAGIEFHHRFDHTIASFFDSFRDWQTFINHAQNLSQDTLWVLLICLIYAAKHLYEGLKAFGVNPAALLASRSGTKSIPDLEKQTALRQSFAEELAEVTRALGSRRRMVLFIDDLDRCMPENIRVVLEAINFIVTSGECFVVMGLARRPVEAGIGLSFKDIADEMTWSTLTPGATQEETAKRKRWEFSRQYLDKLINIEISARPNASANFDELILVDANLSAASVTMNAVAVSALRIILPIMISVLLIVAMGLMGAWVGGKPQAPLPIKVAPVVGSNIPGQAPISPNTAITPQPLATVTPAQTVSLETSTAAKYSLSSYIWPFIGAAFLLYLCWRSLTQKESAVVKDSPQFQKALKVWDKVILASHDTPRSTKRFMNRLRCLAMRLRPGTEDETRWNILWRWRSVESQNIEPDNVFQSTQKLPESMLVALSALYDIAPELVRQDSMFPSVLRGSFGSGVEPEQPSIVSKNMEQLLLMALDQHKAQFGSNWPPTDDQRQTFLRSCADFTVRA
jgi:KAP family P-loop domain